jgi:hypothetical protein
MAGKSDAKARAVQMASLSVGWAVLAGIAYLGLINDALVLVGKQIPQFSNPVDKGLLALKPTDFTSTFQSLANTALIVVPIAVVAVLVLGIAARLRPGLALLAWLSLAASLLGLVSAGVIYLGTVIRPATELQFAVAVATIVVIAVLVRLGKFVRRFYQRAPGPTSILFAAVTIADLVLANQTNVTSLILSNVDAWMALLAFVIATYAGIRLVRATQKM